MRRNRLREKILLFANTDWYLYNFRLPLAKALRNEGYDVVFVSPPGLYTERLTQAGFRWISQPFSRRGINPFCEFITLMRLVSLYRREKPSVVGHYTIKCVLYGSLAAHISGIKQIINSITGLGYVFISSEVRARFIQFFIKRLYPNILRKTHIIFQNPDDVTLFLKYSLIRTDQYTLIKGSGADTTRLTPSEKPAGIILIVLPGRMLFTKGVGEFVAAARILRDKGIKARFALVGDTDLANPDAVPVKQLETWVAEGAVEWWGWQDDIASVYSQAHIVCLPSYREGLPKALIEAGASGCPIVATDAPGCREVVRHGENGLLVPIKDAEALAGALESLINDPMLRKKMGMKGREIVEAEYSESLIVSETIKIFNQLITE